MWQLLRMNSQVCLHSILQFGNQPKETVRKRENLTPHKSWAEGVLNVGEWTCGPKI